MMKRERFDDRVDDRINRKFDRFKVRMFGLMFAELIPVL